MAGLKWLVNSAFAQAFGHMDSSSAIAVQRNEAIAAPKSQESGVVVNKLKETTRLMMKKEDFPDGFQVPLHYPRYSKADYEVMEEWRLDLLLTQYGLRFKGNLGEKRAFAMGSFLWPDQL